MDNRNRSSSRRTGADTELEPSEEFPILYSLLTAPKSHKPKNREQMRDWHKPIAIEADSSLNLEDDYDSSPNNSSNDDSPTPADENDMSLIFNYFGHNSRAHCHREDVAGVVLEDDDDSDSDCAQDDNSPSSTTSSRRRTTIMTDFSRRLPFPMGRRPRRKRTINRGGGGGGGVVSTVASSLQHQPGQNNKISSRGDMPLLEAMIMSSPKVSTTTDFDVRKLNDVIIGLDSSSPARSPTRRITSKSTSHPSSSTTSSPPTLVPFVNFNVNVKVQNVSQISSNERSTGEGSVVLVTENEVINCNNNSNSLYSPHPEQPISADFCRNDKQDVVDALLTVSNSTTATTKSHPHRFEELGQNKNIIGACPENLLNKHNGNHLSHFPTIVPKKRPYNSKSDELHPHLTKALRLGNGFNSSYNLHYT